MWYTPVEIKARPVQITIVIPDNTGFIIRPKANKSPKTPIKVSQPQPFVPNLFRSNEYPIALTELKRTKKPTKRGRTVIEITGCAKRRKPSATLRIPETNVHPQLSIFLRFTRENTISKIPVIKNDQLKTMVNAR